jgi:hypothetical protein
MFFEFSNFSKAMVFAGSALFAALSLLAFGASSARAGVVNPDISALGQLRARVTDDAASPDRNQPSLAPGEAEFIFDAPLNPFFRGAFTVAAGDEGLELEEAYATMVRGLPWGLGLKAGKYRLGMGKLNAVHPHAYPFVDPPRAWVSLMPGGEEGFNEGAFQVSALLPTPGNWASTVSADVLQGSSFHPDDARARLGWLGHWSNTFLVGDAAAWEAGVSGATGVDDVDAKARGYLAGADLKVKFFLPNAGQLTLQGEGLFRRAHRVDTVAGTVPSEDRAGLYAFADWRPHARYNAGVLYDQGQRAGETSATDRAVKLFAGFAVLEESTLIRVSLERFMPDGGILGTRPVHTAAAQLLFSMGPHKAHQF